MFDDMQVMVVVVLEGGTNDWAAYSMTNWMKRQDPLVNRNHWLLEAPLEEFIQKVADGGEKLTSKQAEQLFPDWAERLHWRD